MNEIDGNSLWESWSSMEWKWKGMAAFWHKMIVLTQSKAFIIFDGDSIWNLAPYSDLKNEVMDEMKSLLCNDK